DLRSWFSLARASSSVPATGMVVVAASEAGVLAEPPPSSTRARRSSESLTMRRISATTSSRKSSTSRSSYPRRNWVWVKVLLRTSSGVSAILPPLAMGRLPPRTARARAQASPTSLNDHPEDRDHDDEHEEGEVDRHSPDPQRRDDPADGLEWRVGEGVDHLGDDEERALGPPVTGEDLDPLDDQPTDEDVEVDGQQQAEHLADDH